MSAIPPQVEAAGTSCSTPRRFLRASAAVLMLAAAVCFLFFAVNGQNEANRDFICYWAAGQQLAHHANPYDGPAIFRIEKSVGYHHDQPFFMRNAPSALFLALPLGLVPERLGAILWTLLIVGCLMLSIRLLRAIHGRPPNDIHLAGYLFPPAIACLLACQTGVFVLLGVVLFLRFHRTWPTVAGAALLLSALKPHLFLPFGTVLLAWAISRKAYRLLLSAAAALAASCALSLWLDPSVWAHYAAMMRAEQIQNEFIPNFSLFFRLSIHRNAAWLQFLPALLGCLWALHYFWKRRDHWDWQTDGQLLLLVSVLVAPYSWFTDEVVVLPAILGGLYLAESRRISLMPFFVVAGIALLEVLAAIVPYSGFYLWTAPAWLLWYLWVVRKAEATSPAEIFVAANA